MLEWIKALTILVAVIAVPTLLFFFRVEVRRIVGWIVSLTHLQKNKDGFAITAGGPTEPRFQKAGNIAMAIAAVRAEDVVEIVDENGNAAGTTSAIEESDSWFKASDEKRFDDAIHLLEKEIDVEPDPDRRLTLRGVVGKVMFDKSAAGGIEYFEKLLIEYPNKAAGFAWFALTLSWKDLTAKSLDVLERGLRVVVDPDELRHQKAELLVKIGRQTEAYDVALEGVYANPNFIDTDTHSNREFKK